jgi:hypothetical protein
VRFKRAMLPENALAIIIDYFAELLAGVRVS